MSEPARQGGFRSFRVVEKIPESRIITSLHLEPVDAGGWQPFEPGQFLVLRVPGEGGRRPVPRSYSVSSSPGQAGRYRITVKREAAPSADAPDGIGSCWLHDRIAVGDTISCGGPRGEFVLDRKSPRPVVLLSGGVGLTPMVSMLHALSSDPGRQVDFIHACDNGEVHALRDEVLALARTRAGIGIHFCYRFPTAADRTAGHHQSEGVLTGDLLTRLLPAADRDFYLCGPPQFMQAIYGILRGQGVPKARIAYEFFGPATVLEEVVQVAAAAAPVVTPVSPAATAGPMTVEFRRSGRSEAWSEQAATLLAFAELHGLTPDFSCRSGICGTCKTRLIAGEVTYVEEPLDPPDNDDILICCAKPTGNVVLDL